MPVIQVNDKQHTLKPGQTRIGGGANVDVSVSTDEALGVQAVLELAGNNQVVIRRARDGAMVRVNGVVLGVEPTPLMHGDKVDVSGTEILFSEDKKVGATQFVSASDIASIAAKRSGPARATAGTGGRLVSLVDGKEYQIPAAGVVFGREAGSEVVVAQPEVSRRHASIAPSDTGYILQDLSTNGVWVNGVRIQGSQLLARADVVRVGSEEFRFYADVAPVAKGAPTPSSVPATSPQSQPTPVVATPVQAPPAPPTPPSFPAAAPVAAPPQASPPRPAPAVPAAPAAPAAHAAHAAAPSRAEPPTMPSSVGVSSRPEPPTAPAASRSEPSAPPVATPRPAAAKPRTEAVTAASKEEKKGSVPPWVWFLIIAIVAVAAYLVGQAG